jgi:hypothetical protein
MQYLEEWRKSMMKRTSRLSFLLVAVVTMGLVSGLVVPAPAETADNHFLYSAQSNSLWVLNKTTRKLMLTIFENPGYVWKSRKGSVPDDFNLENAVLIAVGSRGKFVFLCDQITGKVLFFNVTGDGFIERYSEFDGAKELK